MLPYNTLLHTPTREAVGIKLKDNIVIIDEAHNLMDTISSIYSVQITLIHVNYTVYNVIYFICVYNTLDQENSFTIITI